MSEQDVPAPFSGKKFLLIKLQGRLKIMAWSFVLLSFSAYLFCCPVLNTPLVDRLATGPIIETDWVPGSEFMGVPCQQLTFPVRVDSGTLKLSGAFYKHPKAKDVILISHANCGSLTYVHRLPIISYMLEFEHSVFVYDYEGYGVSEGSASYRSLARDGVAAFDYVQTELGYTPSQIVLYGLSMGTGVSCEIARVRSPKAIILDAPYTSVEAAAKHVYPFLQVYPSFLCPEPRYDNLAYLRGKHPPVLILTPLLDPIVPPAQGYTLAREASPSATFVTFPHSTHCFFVRADEELYAESLKSFLKQIDKCKTALKP